jgi:hypothetical protein
MDRMPEPLPTSADVLPPVSAKTTQTLQIAGVAACILTALPAPFGGLPPGPLSTVALFLLAVGLLAAGYGLTLRPGDWRAWALATAAMLFANFGFPPHWDSAAMVCRVSAALLGFGTVLGLADWFLGLKSTVRFAGITALLLFHLGALVCATTSPDPEPWLTLQVSQRVYVPYYRFFYLSNAYHFYSPEPGPASLLFFLVTYELDELDPKTGQPKRESAWLDLPNRATQFKDPLGMTYQRRLSITELVAQTQSSGLTPDNFEKNDAVNRRRQVAVNVEESGGRIPLLPQIDAPVAQYRVPTAHVSRYLLPSYARHVAAEFSVPGRRVVSVKMVRAEHRITQPQIYLPQHDLETGLKRGEGDTPFNPTTYRPYYLGDYGPTGELLNPTDPMLYWLLPIVPRETPNKRGQFFDDYMSIYLKHEFPWTGGVKGAP